MLIQALCEYYDILAEQGKMLPDGYSYVDVHYLVYLNQDGTIDDIIDWREQSFSKDNKGKQKEKFIPREIMLPKRTEKPGIDSNYIEHRPQYLFGLNYDKEFFTPYDSTNKAEKSHNIFKEVNLEFLDGIDSPVVNAYRNFIRNWIPEEQIENPHLLKLGKKYGTSGFAFCLSGQVNYLHNDNKIKEMWIKKYNLSKQNKGDNVVSQCAILGNNAVISRTHSKIKGIYGGLSTGMVLVNFNNPSEESYGNTQSYNSNISEIAMQKYTETLNYIIGKTRQKANLDDMTILYWAMSHEEKSNDIMSALLFHNTDVMGQDEINDMLKSLVRDAKEGNIMPNRINGLELKKNTDFYMLGLKPNSSRLAIKFLYRKKFGEILQNIAQHQMDLQISQELYSVSLWQIKKELISPKSKNDTVDPSMMAKIFESVIYGTNYPQFLLATVIRRVKTDTEYEISRVRAGIIKACINRRTRISKKKEEFKMALDKENKNQAYLCGRLFAILEKLQQNASGGSLNRTIKDAYFSSASSKPATIFPKLLKLAQNHMKKSSYSGFYHGLILEVTDDLKGEFPETLSLIEQGKFIIGYYQQQQAFFVKQDDNINVKKEEN